MIQVAPGTKVYLACRPVSMRFGFDGLAAQVASVLNADPFSGHLFLFRSKRADYLKVLYWDGTGSGGTRHDRRQTGVARTPTPHIGASPWWTA